MLPTTSPTISPTTVPTSPPTVQPTVQPTFMPTFQETILLTYFVPKPDDDEEATLTKVPTSVPTPGIPNLPDMPIESNDIEQLSLPGLMQQTSSPAFERNINGLQSLSGKNQRLQGQTVKPLETEQSILPKQNQYILNEQELPQYEINQLYPNEPWVW